MCVFLRVVDLDRISHLAEELRGQASAERARFGLYREAHEEDAIARATSDGVVLFAAELLSGLSRIDNPVGNSLIALDADAAYADPGADVNLHAVELYGDDLAEPARRRLRITKKEYAAVIGCLFVLVVTSSLAIVGAIWVGRWAVGWVLGG